MPGEEGGGLTNPPPRREIQQLAPSSGLRRFQVTSSGLRSGLRWLAISLLVVAFFIVTTCRQRLRSDPRNGGEASSYRRLTNAGVPDARPRVAVCFYGLTRSLRWTLPSVQNRLLGVLEKRGMRVDIFVHTYSLKEVNNQRAEEMGVDYYRSFVGDYKSLQPTRSLVTNQDDFDAIWPNPLSLTHYKWNYAQSRAGDVIRNVMRAYWSMSLSWGLMAEHAVEGGFEYDAVILARPDVWFHYDIDISSDMFPLPEMTAFIPSFDSDDPKSTRKNDRFAYGSMATMRVVMNRIATLFEPGAGRHGEGIDSEWVFGHHLLKHGVSEVVMNRIATLFEPGAGRHGEKIDLEWVFGHHLLKHGVSVHMLNFLMTRVRLTRDIPKYDHKLVEEACESGVDPMACTIMEAGFTFPQLPANDGAP